MNNAEKALPALLVFTSTAGPQALGTTMQVDANTVPLPVKEELLREQLQELDPYKSTDTGTVYQRVVRGLADIVARPLSTILEKSWRSGDEDWKKVNVTPLQEGLKGGSRKL
ncbi:rna-directed dna polymerase from mobile element jockey-like [Limosa lapponica baueri]|uniref:Rna-directed dna polymerase from mobile element jockey-like n=1 Tax=Limosa lapponica baueri TaxID=1758121 RepID=A0A2I0TVW0_LIMLA|nr:rna-directed dna polymerase from mobile element jockey-like [Limosa lapponica baueri]